VAGKQAKREVSALDWWFRRQRALWWKRWGWLAVGIITVCTTILLLNYFFFFGYILSADWIWQIIYASSFPPGYYIFPYVVLLVSIAFAVSLITYLHLPAEMVVAHSGQDIYRTRLRCNRTILWYWVGLLGVLPALVIEAQPLLFYSIGELGWGAILNHTIWIIPILLLVEGLTAITLLCPTGRKTLWAAACLYVLCSVSRYMVTPQHHSMATLRADSISNISLTYALLGILGLFWLWRFNNRMPKDFTGA
jgi:hypothetical protein